MKIGNRREYGKVRNDEWQDQPADEELEEVDELPEGISNEFPYRAQDAAPTTAQFGNTYRPAEDFTSVIGAGSTWKGDFSTEGSVRLDGSVSGDIKAAGTVHISEGAEVHANIHASYVTIGGLFDGKLVCTDRLELLAASRVSGSITTRLISITEGAVMDGEIHMGSEVKEPVEALSSSRLFATNGSALEESSNGNGAEEKPARIRHTGR